jgi:cell division protein ZapA
MSQVNVTINGRQFRMACDDGEEDALKQLAQDLDKRINVMRERFGEIGDARLTVMAAIEMADQLAETSLRLRQVEQELAALQQARVAAGDRAQATHVAVANALNAAAERIEGLTRRLNQSLGNGVAIG